MGLVKTFRTFREFAEAEIILPSGPREGLQFSTAYAPWTGLVLDEFERPDWRRIFIAGAVQSGKTLLGFCLPILYHLFEIGEDVIVGCPDVAMAQDIWSQRILPILNRTKYRALLPAKGAGSRGGRFKAVQFNHGPVLRFMGAGGGDAQRSSHTARVVVLTEIDKMDAPGAVSRETDPVRQIEARTSAYSDSARIYAECTVSIPEGRVWQEVHELGTGSRIFLQCPGCKCWNYPERENFTGWLEAGTILEARKAARYKCPGCGRLWTEADRLKALKRPRLVHKGQEIKAGRIKGPEPRTNTLGIIWTGYHSPMMTTADLAEIHWRAARTETEEDEKYLCQYIWAVPYQLKAEEDKLTPSFIQGHGGDYDMDGEAPADVDFLICGIDIQKFWLYYVIEGYKAADLTEWTLDFGVQEIIPPELRRTVDPDQAKVFDALDAVKETALKKGCRAIWVDTGWKHTASTRHIVRDWCRPDPQVFALVGRGHGQMGAISGSRVKGVRYRAGDGTLIHARRQADKSLLWFLDVDGLKIQVHHGFRIPLDLPGCHYLPRQIVRRENEWFCRHVCAEQYLAIQKPGAGLVREWTNPYRRWRHDILDCLAYARAGALYVKYQMDQGKIGGRKRRRHASYTKV